MQITLGEDNGFLNNGVPTMLVVTVLMDDGKKVRFPYDATKSMSALYEDVRAFCKEMPVYRDVPVTSPKILDQRDTSLDKLVVVNSDRIEREDIVRCVLLEKRESSCDLKVGGEYRVLKAHRKDLPTGPNGEMQTVYDGYDVIDDASKNPIRTMVFPHEVVLLRKRVPPPEKISVFEQIVSCADCGEPSALALDKEKDKYIGECAKCHKPLEADRVKQSNQTPQ